MISNFQASLKNYNTFGIDAAAKELVFVHSLEELKSLLPRLRTEKFMFLGGGSNVLFINDFNGLVVINQIKGLKADLTEFIEITEEAVTLATEYINEKVVGRTSYADCLHIALATINRADFLVSWNFKHIVNIERIRGYNAINIKNGFKQLEIRSPREFEKYEDD